MFLPRQYIDDREDIAPDDGVTVERVKSCAGGEFASCSMPIIFGAIAGAGLITFLIWYWWRSGHPSKTTRENQQRDKEAAKKTEEKRIDDANREIAGDLLKSVRALIPKK